MTEKLLYTVQETADLLSIGRTEVYALAAKGVLEKRYIGKAQFRIHIDDIRAYVDALPREPISEAS